MLAGPNGFILSVTQSSEETFVVDVFFILGKVRFLERKPRGRFSFLIFWIWTAAEQKKSCQERMKTEVDFIHFETKDGGGKM